MRWILLLLFAATSAGGQERFQLYTTDNGLPNNSVLAMLQAKDGYLWFTTYRGIVRFDGLHFQVFDSSTTPAIRGTTFAAFSLIEDRNGALWAGCWNGGAIRYQNGVFSAFTSKDGLPNNRVVRIDEDEQGIIWIFTNPGLSRIRNGKVEVVRFIDGEPVQPYLGKLPSLEGDFYLFGLWRLGRGRSGLQRFAYGKWSDMPLPPGVRNPAAVRIYLLLEDSQKRVWFYIAGRPGETYCVQDGRLSTFKGLPAGAFANYRDRLGRLWITDHKGHTATWEGGRATPLTGVSTASALRVLEDSEGSFWVGTLNQGLVHATRQVITSVHLPGGPEANAIRPLVQDAAGDIWVGSCGLTRLHGGRFHTYFQPYPDARWRADQIAFALWVDPDGTIFFGYRGGVKTFKQGRFQEPERPLRQIKSEVDAIFRDHTGNLWLGTEQGLFLYRDSKLSPFDGPLRGQVRAIAEDKTGTLWIGTDDVLCKRRNGVFSCFGSGDELSQWRVRSILADADDVIWVATAGLGLLRIAGESFRWIQAKDGLYANDPAAILEDTKGYFWISCQRGIFRVKKQELNAFAQGRISRVTTSFYGMNDGLNSSDCTGYGQPHGFVAKDGTLWFPTVDGLATIDPKTLPVNSAPPRLRIESCFLAQHRIPCEGQISLASDVQDLEIKYTALNLFRPDQIQFRYKLEGLDPTWVDVGTRRTAYYSHLAPGRYRFSVTATNGDGVWSTAGRGLGISVQPHYYQTPWFRLLVTALTISIFLLAWRRRTVQYSERQALQRAFAQRVIASQEMERKRIAGELHDSLGQRLTVIRNMALLLNRSGTRDQHEKIEAIAAETSEAIGEVRQISHNLRPYQLDLVGLTKAIEVLVARTCEAAGIRADVFVDDLSGAFPREMEIHFYRVVQECLTNIVKHSKATSASVLVRRTGAGVSLILSDDGVGFDPGRPSGEGGGFGLTGISERAQLLGGKAIIQSAPGRGTAVTIEINTGSIHAK